MGELNMTPPLRSSSRILAGQSSTKKSPASRTISARKTPKRKNQKTPRRDSIIIDKVEESPSKKQQTLQYVGDSSITVDRINETAVEEFGGTDDVIQRVRIL